MYKYTGLYKRTLLSNSAGVEPISKKPLESSATIKIVLASDSKLFLEGLRKVLEDGSGIKIVAEASNCEEAAKRLTEVGVKFLFIDSRAFNLDYGELSDLVNKKGSDTKVILLGNQARDRINLPGVIYVNK
jgi:PleD family two-component response regulator